MENSIGGLLNERKQAEQARNAFFFSSRRRHTRCSRDWSSHVCSSDLLVITLEAVAIDISLRRGEVERGKVDAESFLIRGKRERARQRAGRPVDLQPRGHDRRSKRP